MPIFYNNHGRGPYDYYDQGPPNPWPHILTFIVKLIIIAAVIGWLAYMGWW